MFFTLSPVLLAAAENMAPTDGGEAFGANLLGG